MIFSRSRARTPDIELFINSVKIKREAETKFLGVIVDEALTWKKHIATVRTKMSRYLGVMYKLRCQLPLKARLLIYHSFIQSHLNYCCLIWGFAANSHIESLFRKQKAGMRAIMPGKVIYRYRNGEIPTHTKSSFCSYGILAVQNIIVKNALLLMHRIHFYKSSLPPSVSALIPTSAPCPSDNRDHTLHKEWLDTYNTVVFRDSIFFKGPLLTMTTENEQLLGNKCNMTNLHKYKQSLRKLLVEMQRSGGSDEWPTFLLNNIKGLRQSNRQKVLILIL